MVLVTQSNVGKQHEYGNYSTCRAYSKPLGLFAIKIIVVHIAFDPLWRCEAGDHLKVKTNAEPGESDNHCFWQQIFVHKDVSHRFGLYHKVIFRSN